jgi:hypothetical protein
VQEERQGVLPTCPAYVILLMTSFCCVFFLLAFQCGESQAKHGKHSNKERQVHLVCFTGKDKSRVLFWVDWIQPMMVFANVRPLDRICATGVSQGL